MPTFLNRISALLGLAASDEAPLRKLAGPRIYISYRRSDSAGLAGRIFDRLTAHFGADRVFIDIGGIPLGVSFASALNDEIRQCDVVLALIGDAWASRILNEDDFVRTELRLALAQGKSVVPLLLDDAQMPGATDLPDDLRPIVYRNAISISSATYFHRDLDVLIAALSRLQAPGATRDRRDSRFASPAPEISVDLSSRSRVFLSHSTQDRTWVETFIVSPLNDASIPSW